MSQDARSRGIPLTGSRIWAGCGSQFLNKLLCQAPQPCKAGGNETRLDPLPRLVQLPNDVIGCTALATRKHVAEYAPPICSDGSAARIHVHMEQGARATGGPGTRPGLSRADPLAQRQPPSTLERGRSCPGEEGEGGESGVHKQRPSPPWILDARPDWSSTEPFACLAPPPPCPSVVLRLLYFAPGGGRAELVPAGARPCRPVRVRGFRTSREWPSTAVGLAGRPSRTRSRRVVEVGCWPGRGRLSAVPSLSAQHSPICTVRVTGDTVLPRPEVGRGQG